MGYLICVDPLRKLNVRTGDCRLNESLRLILVDRNPRLWDKYCNFACYALNSLKNRVTGFSANRLVFGHELNTPASLLFAETIGETRSEVTDYNKVAVKLHREFKTVIHTVAKRMQTVFEREELEETQPPFKAGELCFVRIRCPKHKFSVRYFGPTKIVKSVNDRVYVVDINGEEKVVNFAKP